jgi:hypothetical protein
MRPAPSHPPARDLSTGLPLKSTTRPSSPPLSMLTLAETCAGHAQTFAVTTYKNTETNRSLHRSRSMNISKSSSTHDTVIAIRTMLPSRLLRRGRGDDRVERREERRCRRLGTERGFYSGRKEKWGRSPCISCGLWQKQMIEQKKKGATVLFFLCTKD